ncbi:hypothetical protein, partial [Pseudoalteromonas atlantica]|uniref:hypothetical protein n=1 Tax=Pseudoalteromonas atlantica TaxID=288 RepID=UPI00373656DF
MRLIALLYFRQQKTRCIAATGFSNLNPGDDLLSHNKCYTIIGRGSPSSCFVSLLSSAWGLGYLLNLKKQKTRCIAATGFSNLNPGDDLLSHNK